MFGSSDNQQTTTMGPPAVQDPAMLDGVQPPAQTPPSDSPVTPSQTVGQPSMPASPAPAEHVMTTDNPFIQNPITDTTSSSSPSTDQAPAATPPITPAFPTDTQTAPSSITDTPVLENETSDEAKPEPTDESSTAPALTPLEPVNTDQLASMKQEALGHLEPLVGHLDQGPEEEFKTVMMMIQANDNHTLLEKALEAAKKIEDDKARAQAMLDIINEINYFSTQY